MKSSSGTRNNTAVLLVAALLGSGLAVAAGSERSSGRDDDRRGRNDNSVVEQRGRFEEGQRDVARAYYTSRGRAGQCPPGLAKKNNGCNPPGQLKQWQIGQPLAPEATWYQLSHELEQQLGQAPAGYRYAGVDDNILLLEIGTLVVVDAIQALGQ